MRCSLLSISSYLDGELSPERSGELEAHLVACSRCSNGLGYLSEEKQRIRTLLAVHAREGAAEELLASVGLVAAPREPEQAVVQSPPQFLLDLPDTPAAPPLQEVAAAVDTLELPGTATPKPAPNGTNGTVAPAPPQPPPLEAAQPTSSPPRPPEPAEGASMGPLRTPSPASWYERARDTIALRWALLRGVEIDDDEDDSIQIVSGDGAPPRATSRSVDRPARTVGPQDEPIMAAAEARSFDPEAAPPVESPLEPHRVVPPLAFRDYGIDSYHPSTPAQREPETPPRAPEPQPEPDGVAAEDTPIAAQQAPNGTGRHVRALQGAGRSWKLPTLQLPRPRPSDKRPEVASPLADRRLWVFGAAVAILGLIGVLVGKQVTEPANPSLATGAVPNPTAIAMPSASAHAPTAAATPVPTPAATPVPTPTPAPAQPNPAQLTGTQTLGAGATGLQVVGLRYGEHPSDFRIVFDLSGGATPTTQVGFGNPTTLYVEFSGVAGSPSPAQPPAGQTATAVKLLQPSPIAGKTIYQITLAKPATLGTSYLLSPTRLVIDLG